MTILEQTQKQKGIFITPAQLAQRWQVTEMTLRRWRKAGTLRTHFFGRRVRFSLVDIEQFEQQSKS